MLSIRQLDKSIDSLKRYNASFKKKIVPQITPYLFFTRYLDTGWISVKPAGKQSIKSIKELIPDSQRSYILDRTISQIGSIKSSLDVTNIEYEAKQKELLLHLIEWHRKLTMSIACLVLFLIGAPLGSIIRKGGLGTPLVFAVAFFVVFFLLNNFGLKLVKTGVVNPIPGMWLATIVLSPVGFFLTYKAMRDSQLFNQEYYFRTIKKLAPYFEKLFRKKTSEVPSATV